MSDLISRQAAIDICANAIDLWHGQLGEGALVAVRDMISDLPPAQPEIIYCRDCKYFELDHFEKVDEFPIPIIVAHEICMKWSGGCRTSIDGWCFMAERRTDEDD